MGECACRRPVRLPPVLFGLSAATVFTGSLPANWAHRDVSYSEGRSHRRERVWVRARFFVFFVFSGQPQVMCIMTSVVPVCDVTICVAAVSDT